MRHIGTAARWMALSMFLWGVGEGLWQYIQPLYPERLGANPQQTGLTLAMMGVGRMLGIAPFTIAMDRYNPSQVLLPGYISGVVGMALLAIAPNWQFTMIGFFIHGFSFSALIPLTVYLTNAYEHDHTRRNDVPLHSILTFTWATNAAGIIVSPAVGGYMGEVLGLRSVFALSSFVFLLSTLAVLRCPIYPFSQAMTLGLENRRLFRSRNFMLVNGLFALIFTAGPVGYVLLPRFLEEHYHYTTNTLGLLGTLTAIGIALWSLIMGQRSAWTGFLIGQGFIALAFGIFLVSHHQLAIGMGYFLYGAWSALRPMALSIVTWYVSVNQHSFAFAIIDLTFAISSTAAPLIAGLLYTRSPSLPFIAVLALTGVTFGMSLSLRNHKPRFAYIEKR